MARTFPSTPEEIARARALMENHGNEREYRAAAIFLFMSLNKVTAENCAEVFGVSVRTLFKDVARIRDPAPPPKGGWGGARHRLMSFEREARFLELYSSGAENGLITTAKELHREYDKLVGRETPPSTFYRLLRRHGWRPAPPDGKRPGASPEAREGFGKNRSGRRWRRLPSKK